ncbi:hypothetical protein [Halomonas sp. M4R1S46]|uniref:hypothetical protein n=1 Tax=Halomonas sp. M4R1S46 TaxID=2982692 RepID=UPI0021E47F06|nr:hypothetical protein [Halomonas sp. M4R1S46]UYG06323.1 hypothetical protein OCT48_11835 [Halomonas sp. M4R1S46]
MNSQGSAPPEKARFARRAKNRARAWEWTAKGLKPGVSVWRLEWIKAAVALAEDRLDSLPPPSESRGHPVPRWRVALAMAVGCVMAGAYVLRQRGGARQGELPPDATRVAAIHAEWSTRTRHLLTAIDNADSPVYAVILLGRLQSPPEQTAALWESKRPGSRAATLPLVLPMSPRACLAALSDLPELLREGFASSSHMPLALPFREQIAISFRVVLGAVAARWWKETGATEAEVLFAITGTADTTLLENAIQQTGGHTVHALHGQAMGPNFAGVSNLALFRSRHDAVAYSRLGCYGRCEVQSVPQPRPMRGTGGLLLLSNLAHPMNPDFRRQPLRDELALLACVGSAARRLGAVARPLLWKPHPVIAGLSEDMRATLRTAALQEGFTELPPESDLVSVAADCRWILTSPSTVALDLLEAGYLSVVLDPQGSVLDTALAGLPQSSVEPEALTTLLERLDACDAYTNAFSDAFAAVGPARAFDLVSIRFNSGE